MANQCRSDCYSSVKMYNKGQLRDRFKYNVSMHYIVAVLQNVLNMNMNMFDTGNLTNQCASGGKELQASSSVQFFYM